MGDKFYFSGRNLQQALLSASRKLGLRPEEIAYSDRTKAHGTLKGTRAVIEVDGSHPGRGPGLEAGVKPPVALPQDVQAPIPWVKGRAPEPALPSGLREPGRARPGRGAERRDPASDRPSEVPPEQVKEAAEEAARLLAAVAGVRPQPEARIVDGTAEVDLSPRGRVAVAVTDEVLLALRQLLPKALRGLVGFAVPCRVDLAGSLQAQEEALREAALRAAHKALAERRAVSLEPMGSADRRVVHMALREVPGIRTESEGAGGTRAVVIRPA